MGEAFHVRVEGIRFDAAHFETFGDNCEPLHGHSYEVAAEVHGELNSDSLVVDFGRIKAILRDLSKQLDHRFLLQRDSRRLGIEALEAAWKIHTPNGLDYVMPAQDVVSLPVDNSSAERLSEWFAARLWQALQEKRGSNLRWLEVDVFEGPGQRASYRMERLPLD
jgi:6-pyruvoyltetrahydropterin/6-carboxytetrahydropterin synthase